MALRIEAGVGAGLMLGLILCATPWAARAESLTFEARHRHVRNGGHGTLSVEAQRLSFRESGKGNAHSREWKYEDIQQLTLGTEVVRLLTYEDVRWQLGRDREYTFDGLPEGFVAQVRDTLLARLGSRLVASEADSSFRPMWRIPAKLERAYGGSQGVLAVGEDRVVYRTEAADASRTWPMGDIENVSSSGPYDLTITTAERFGWRRGGGREARFQLKEPLDEGRYNKLWKAVQRTKGLETGEGK